MDVVLSITFMILFMKKLFFLIFKRIEFKTAERMQRKSPVTTSNIDHKLEPPQIQLTTSNTSSIDSVDYVTSSPESPEHLEIESKEYNVTKLTVVPVETVKMVTKSALLVVVAVFSTFFALLLASLPINYDVSDVPIHMYSYLGIDSFINGMCIYLFFKWNKETYYRLCKCGNNLCTKCCICCIICRMKNKLKLDNDTSFDHYQGLLLHD